MTLSENINELAAALVLAQSMIQPPKRTHTAKGTTFSYKYSTLDDLVSVLREPLKANGLAYVQTIDTTDGPRGRVLGVETIILHKSGQWISTGYIRLPAGETGQQAGSAASYARRYSLSAAFGVAAEDNDGEGAVSEVDAHAAPKPQTAQTPPVQPFGFHSVGAIAQEVDLSQPFGAPPPPPPPTPPALDTPALFDPPTSPDDRSVLVTKFKRAKGTTNGKPWTCAFVAFSNGTEGASFDAATYDLLERAGQQARRVLVTLETSKKDPSKNTIVYAALADVPAPAVDKEGAEFIPF